MQDRLFNETRRAFLGTSAQALSGVTAASAMAAPAGTSAVKEPAVIGYPNKKGVTIERVTYPARNLGTIIVAICSSQPVSTPTESTRQLS